MRCPSSGPVAAGLAWTPRVLTPARHHAAPAGQWEAHGRSPEGGAHPQLSRPPQACRECGHQPPPPGRLEARAQNKTSHPASFGL